MAGFSQTHDEHDGHNHDGHNHQAQAPVQNVKFNYIDSILKYKVSEKHASQFGRLVIQDDGGRMKPINTFSSELLRKVSKSDKYKDMNSDQVFVSMTQFPIAWYEVPLVYIKVGNDSIRKIIGIEKGAKICFTEIVF